MRSKRGGGFRAKISVVRREVWMSSSSESQSWLDRWWPLLLVLFGLGFYLDTGVFCAVLGREGSPGAAPGVLAAFKAGYARPRAFGAGGG